MGNFFKNALEDMKESARAQHQVDQANFQAVKAEAKANWEETKAKSSLKARKAEEQEKRDQAWERIAQAQARIDGAKNNNGNP